MTNTETFQFLTEADLTEAQKFEQFLARREEAQRAAQAELRRREQERAEQRRPFAVLAAFARS